MIKFISYGKAISIIIVLLVHVFSAFWNSEIWSIVVRTPAVPLSYPKLSRAVNAITFDGLAGFLVVGAVCFFFLCTGYTIARSLEHRSFVIYWRHRFFRLVPFYAVVLVVDFVVAHVAAFLYGTGIPYGMSDYLWQLLVGLQYFVPGVVVLDPVIWFVGVDLCFCFYASVFRITTRKNVLLMDGGILLSVIALSLAEIYGGVGIAAMQMMNFAFKAIILSAFILCATLLSLGDSEEKRDLSFPLIAGQFLFFLLLYRWKIVEIGYLDVASYLPWFLCYLLIFICARQAEAGLGKHKILSFLDRMSFSLYISHGYIGYFMVSSLVAHGMGKSVSCLISIPPLLYIAYVLSIKIEQPIARVCKKHGF